MKIKVLPEDVINKIAAGEIIERPASVVKELIENSIDAGGNKIFAEIVDGGRRLVRVIDNGEGMNKDDALLAFERHATSKLREENDLYSINSMGFRGEALPSIASISKVSLITMNRDSTVGTQVDIEGGVVKRISEVGRSIGTTIEVSDLFYNTPVRRRFLKKVNTELSYISHLFYQEAMAHPWIHFRLTHNGRELSNYPSVRGHKERIMQIFGHEMSSNLIEVEERNDSLHLKGYISRPLFMKTNNSYQEIFINRRSIKSTLILHAVYEAYETLSMRNHHPVIFLFLEIDPSLIDVNVHPTKREVRFSNHREIYVSVRDGIKKILLGEDRLKGSPSLSGRDRRYQGWRGVIEEISSYSKVDKSKDSYGYAKEKNGDANRIKESDLYYQSIGFSSHSISSSSCNIRSLGQIHNTFIIAEVDNELQIIDQHTAHERVLYERYTRGYKDSNLEIQSLLIPEHIELSLHETLLIRDYLKELKRMGLEIEEFGENSFIIRTIPAIGYFGNLHQLLTDLIHELANFERNMTYEERIKGIITSLSCHGAIRANHLLQKEEIIRLLQDLMKTEIPYTCPHGRPIAMRFTKEELEKRFYRR